MLSHQVKHVKSDAVDVTIEVQENSPTVVNEVRFTGIPPELARHAPRAWRRAATSRPATSSVPAYAEVKDGLSQRLKEGAYAYGQVAGGVNVDQDKHTATIEMVATPGPKVASSGSGNGAIPAWRAA